MRLFFAWHIHAKSKNTLQYYFYFTSVRLWV
nr:MAG TPA: hypothetical protein [Caudoviricetes sp.]